MISKVGYNYLENTLSIKTSDGEIYIINYDYEDYLEFIKSDNADELFIEKICPIIEEENGGDITPRIDVVNF